MTEKRESTYKEFVNVLAVHWAADGHIEPVRAQREDGTVLVVSRVLDVRRAASMRAGGQGIRYTCRVTNREDGEEFVLELFHEGDYWFVERKK